MLVRFTAVALCLMLAVSVYPGGGERVTPHAAGEPVPVQRGTLTGKLICIDPGHGGSATGTTGIDGPGYPDEKDLNLDMGLYLRDLLLEHGASVVMTRESDVDVSLAERCSIANTAGADIYISIHCNAISNNATTGTETFYWGEDASTYSVNGRRLAERVQEEEVDHLGSNDRGALMDLPYLGYHLYVLDNTVMPAILTEVGFMSNQTEFDKLNTTWYRHRAMEAVCDGVLRYFRTDNSPMRLDSDADLAAAAASGGWPGTGTASDPYIIEGYDIDGTGQGGCIYLGNITYSVLVRECSLHRASGNYVNWYYDTGLYIYNSPNVTVVNVSAYLNGGYGIRFQATGGGSASECDAHLNGYYGVYLRYASNVSVENCSANNNTYSGMIMYRSDANCSIKDSEVMDNGAYGIYMDGCTDVLAAGNMVLNNTDYGLYGLGSASCRILGNRVEEHGSAGIYLTSSQNSLLDGNTVLAPGDCGIEIGSGSTGSMLSWNTVSGGSLYGIQIGDDFGGADGCQVSNNTVSNTGFFGIYVLKSGNVSVYGNTVFHNGEFGIYAKLSQYLDIHHNLAYDNVYGICLRYSTHNSTVRYNTCHSNNRFAASYITAGIAVEYASPDNLVMGNSVYNQSVSNGTGILVQGSRGCLVEANNMSSNIFGGYLYDANGSSIRENDISGNQLGLFLDEFCTGNIIASNNFLANGVQANDSSGSQNSWDAGYPEGGNYWSELSGPDGFHGPAQDMPGSDGILDMAYTGILNTTARDYFPLASPFQRAELTVPLQGGWNLVSLPVRQLNFSIDAVLASASGTWDRIYAHNNTGTGVWHSFSTLRPGSLNDLGAMSHIHGYWVHCNGPADLVISGDMFGSSLSIPLRAGWNLVGYPSMTSRPASEALAGTGADMLAVHDAGQPYLIQDIADLSTVSMQPGLGYWIHVPADATWTVSP